MATALLGSTSVNGQVLYQDFDPDLHADGEFWFPNNIIELDINMDGEIDVTLLAIVWDPCMYCAADYHVNFIPESNVRAAAYLSESHICTDCFGTFTVAEQHIVHVIPEGEVIPGGLDFGVNPNLVLSFNQGNFSTCWTDPGCHTGPTLYNGYIPIRLTMDDLPYFGWIRLSIGFFATVTVYKTALQLVSGADISTLAIEDSMVIGPATDLVAVHLAEEGLPSDYRLQALPAAGETYLERYRLFILPADDYTGITASDLDTMPETHSLTWIPNNDTIDLLIPNDQLAYDGTPLMADSSYVFVILHELTDNPVRYLSEFSAPFIFDLKVSAPVSVGYSLDCIDEYPPVMTVSWEAPEDALSIAAYRIYLGEDPSPGGGPPPLPDPVELYGLPEDRFIEVPAGAALSYEATLPNSFLDISGNNIEIGTTYVLFVMSIPAEEYQIPTYQYLLDVHRGFLAQPVSDIEVSDIGDAGIISDIHYSYTQGSPETYTAAYRLLLNRVGQPEPDTAAIIDAPVGTFTYEPIAGSIESGYLSASSTTWDGEDVMDDTYYYLLIASLPNAEPCAYISIVRSDTFLYSNPAPPVNIINVVDASDYGTALDLEVTFMHAADESKISEYRIILSENLLLDDSIVDTLAPNQYVAVAADAPGESSTVSLKHFLLDVDNQVIEPNKDYYVYIQSKSIPGYNSGLSLPFTFAQFNPAVVTDVQLNDTHEDLAASDLQISFSSLTFDAQIESYRIYILEPEDSSYISAAYLESLPAAYFLSVSTGSPEMVINGNESVLTLSGEPIALYTPYIATVMAYDEEQANQYLSPFSNVVSLSVSTAILNQNIPDFSVQLEGAFVVIRTNGNPLIESLILRDLYGRSTGINNQPIQGGYRIPINSLASGIYLLEVRIAGQTQAVKIILP